jgi:hypothetical protein
VRNNIKSKTIQTLDISKMKLSEKSLGFLSWALESDDCKLNNLIMDYCSISSTILNGLGIFL